MNGRLPTLRRLILAFCLLLAIPTHAVTRPEEMLHIVFRMEYPDVPPSHFGAQPKALWRVGLRLLRLEEAYNPATGLHLLFITRAPDSWIIDRRTSRAKHVVDPGPSIDVHMPILPPLAPGRLKELEFGNEVDFFRRHGAVTVSVPGQPAAKKWSLNLDGYKLVLLVQSGDRPLRLRVENPQQQSYTIAYERYERHPRIDRSMFELPAGLTIEEAKPAPVTSPSENP